MSGSRTSPPALKHRQNTPNTGQNSVSDEQIAHDTYGSNTSTPVPSIVNNDDNEPILMEDTVRDSNELALTAQDDIETAKLIVSQQNKLDKIPKPSSAPSSSAKKPED